MRRLALMAAVALGACSSAPKGSTSGATSCARERTVIVRNRSNRDADVVAERRGGGAPFELGTVMQGRQEEFTLPAEATTARARFAREGGTQIRGTVDVRYGCR